MSQSVGLMLRLRRATSKKKKKLTQTNHDGIGSLKPHKQYYREN